MELNRLLNSTGEWLQGTGPESEIVISTRMRLARNVASIPFMTLLAGADREKAERKIRESILRARIVENNNYLFMPELSKTDRAFLVERHLISRELADTTGPAGAAISDQEMVSVMVMEEDHLRLQVLQAGLRLSEAWRIIDTIDNKVEGELEYAFSNQFGYLTACPTNVGTGLRVSVMLHLPALCITRHIDRATQAVSKIFHTVRGIYGEGTEPLGHLYQISNQITLGKSEEEIIANVEKVIPQIIEYEQKARETLLMKDRIRLEDRAWQAFALLKYARILSSEQVLTLLSAVRLGVHLQILPNIDIRLINELMLFSQPAHLQKITGEDLGPGERDERRALFVRDKLKNIG